jgi:DNA repair protein RadC
MKNSQYPPFSSKPPSVPPSGIAEPSGADELLTHKLKTALALVDIRVLDHIVIGGMQTVSFAEKGLL